MSDFLLSLAEIGLYVVFLQLDERLLDISEHGNIFF